MSNSYSNNTKDNIKFNEKPIINLESILVNANSSEYFYEQEINKKCEYIKLVCGLTSEDKKLTTDYYNAVCIDCTIHYFDENNNRKSIVDSFYPRYKHENNNLDDFTIISSPTNIDYIDIEIINNENVDIDITELKVYISEDIGDELNDYYNNGGQTVLVIPLVQTLPDVDSVPDGYICRLASIE